MIIKDPDRMAEVATLEEARRFLTARLHRNPADFVATKDLQAVSAMLADIRPRIDSSQSDRVAHGGLSNVERTRMWFRSGVRRRSRHARTAVRAKPRPFEAVTLTTSTRLRPVRVAVP